MKNIDEKQLEIISMEFRTVADRLITRSRQTGMTLLKKFMAYIDESEIISEYIEQYVNPDDFEPVERGTCFSSVDDTRQEEISYTYQYLKYAVESYHSFYHDIVFRYAGEANDATKGFCNQIALPFVNYIEGYLAEIDIQMGYDKGRKFMINVNGGVAQVNVTNGDATVYGTQSNGIGASQLENIISDIMKYILTGITREEQEQINDSVEVIRTEVQSTGPQKGFIKAVLKGLQAINGTVQFGSAIATLVQLLETVL